MSSPRRLPTGTITFLFTDVVGSTALWDTPPKATRQATVRHDELIERADLEICRRAAAARPGIRMLTSWPRLHTGSSRVSRSRPTEPIVVQVLDLEVGLAYELIDGLQQRLAAVATSIHRSH
jgi:hypothetical protein